MGIFRLSGERIETRRINIDACLGIKKKEAFGFLCFERGLRASSFLALGGMTSDGIAGNGGESGD